MIEIKRQNHGGARTRFRIVLHLLKPRHRRILLDNPIIKKNSEDDRFLQCIMKLEDARITVSHANRIYFNRETREVLRYSEMLKSMNFLNWKCAYCKKDIKSEINNYKIENFVCKPCLSYYVRKSQFINQKLIDESLKFSEYHKRKIKEDQKKFLKYIKKNDPS